MVVGKDKVVADKDMNMNMNMVLVLVRMKMNMMVNVMDRKWVSDVMVGEQQH